MLHMPLKEELSHELLFGSQTMDLDHQGVISRDFQSRMSWVSVTIRANRYVAYTSKSCADAMIECRVFIKVLINSAHVSVIMNNLNQQRIHLSYGISKSDWYYFWKRRGLWSRCNNKIGFYI